MATILNDPACVLSGWSNTGKPDCDLKPSQMIGAILIPRGSHFAVADVADIVHVLGDLTMAAAGSRVFPIWEFVEIKDNSEAPVKVTSGYGEETTTRQGKYKWDFKLNNSTGILWWAQMQSFHQSNFFDVLFVDDGNTIWGKRGPTAGELMGLGIGTIDVNNWKPADGVKPVELWLTLNLSDPRDLNENVAFIKPATSVKDNVKGILNVTITEGAAEAYRSYSVKAKTTIGAVDLFGTYNTVLDNHTAWVVKQAGVALTISEVAHSHVFNGWTITTSDGSAGAVTVELADAATLAALGMGGSPDEGFESDILTLTDPGA